MVDNMLGSFVDAINNSAALRIGFRGMLYTTTFYSDKYPQRHNIEVAILAMGASEARHSIFVDIQEAIENCLEGEAYAR